jgi:hypothetical protein
MVTLTHFNSVSHVSFRSKHVEKTSTTEWVSKRDYHQEGNMLQLLFKEEIMARDEN